MKKKGIIIILTSFLIIVAAIFLVTSVSGKRGATAVKSKTEKASVEKPNIVLIVIDTLRADHVSSYGYFRDTTPQIDNFAKNAFRFTNLVSASSWTMPSHMSMLTGLYPGVHKTTDYTLKLDEKIITLAEALKSDGYYTAGFISNPTLEAKHGFAKGFDFYDDFTVDLDCGFNLLADQDVEQQSVNLARTSPPLNKVTLGWLKTNYDKRFFLFVHYFDPHYDHIPPPPYDTFFDPDYKGTTDGRGITSLKPDIPKRDLEHIISLYDGEIRYTDEYVGALLKEIENLGLKENTFIIIVSDHGDEFFEHGATAHGHTLYDELIRVPLIIKLPGSSHKPAVINALASDVDLMPTICDYLKISVPRGVQGRSLLPIMNGEKGEERPYVFSEVSIHKDANLKAVIGNGFKFIYNFDNGEKELYNLKEDPKEKKNLVKTEPQKAALLKKELMHFVNSSGNLASVLKSSGDNKVVGDEDTKKKLKALGYMQ